MNMDDSTIDIALDTLKMNKQAIVFVNSKPLELVEPEIARLRLMEPIAIAGDVARTLNIDVSVSGGGVMGQADAARQAAGREARMTVVNYSIERNVERFLRLIDEVRGGLKG